MVFDGFYGIREVERKDNLFISTRSVGAERVLVRGSWELGRSTPSQEEPKARGQHRTDVPPKVDMYALHYNDDRLNHMVMNAMFTYRPR